jgi:AcrR family transcriptional regulator
MGRTRAALLDGARLAVQVSGTKITMSQVATSAGVAKATLYNHFRTREAVLSALVLDEVRVLVEAAGDKPLADALACTAATLSTHPMLRTLARDDAAVLAGLARIDPGALAWQQAYLGTEKILAASGRGGAETVLRWLASYLISPATPASIAADLAVLIAGLPDVPAASGERVGGTHSAVPAGSGELPGSAERAGGGYPGAAGGPGELPTGLPEAHPGLGERAEGGYAVPSAGLGGQPADDVARTA